MTDYISALESQLVEALKAVDMLIEERDEYHEENDYLKEKKDD